jgi:hypothetical protein
VPGKIFINYRRGDDPGNTGRLFDRLRDVFDPDQLFLDVDNIPPGVDFVRVLNERVADCDALLAVIGKGWLDLRDAKGARRLDDPDDFVRIEIESALNQGKRVIPVLVGGGQMPSAEELPESLRPLARRNAVRLTHERFRADADGLIKALRIGFGEVEARIQTNLEPQPVASYGAALAAGNSGRLVFVSYPKDVVPTLLNSLVSPLIKHGLRLWLYDPSPYGFSDEQLESISWQHGGESFVEQTLRAARRSDAVLFLISRRTLESKFQRNELDIALKIGRFVPCIVDETIEAQQLPPKLRGYHVLKIGERSVNDSVKLKMLVNDVLSAAAKKKTRIRKPTSLES